MRRSYFVGFPWDINRHALDDTTISGGIRPVPSDSLFEEEAGKEVALLNINVARSIYARVKSWRFYSDGVITVGSGAGEVYGTFNLTLDAVGPGDVPLENETELGRHIGWYGEEDQETLWGQDGPDFYPGVMKLRLWPFIYIPSGLNDIAAMPRPELEFLLVPGEFGENGITFGQVEGDACEVTSPFPATKDETWDGLNFSGFTLQLSGNNPATSGGQVHNPISGSVRLEPYKYWSYDHKDDIGPRYDEDTGLWLVDDPKL